MKTTLLDVLLQIAIRVNQMDKNSRTLRTTKYFVETLTQYKTHVCPVCTQGGKNGATQYTFILKLAPRNKYSDFFPSASFNPFTTVGGGQTFQDFFRG